MSDFKERLETERSELDVKATKLFKFMSTPDFFKVEEVQQSLLTIQYDAMVTYLSCLNERLKHLKK